MGAAVMRASIPVVVATVLCRASGALAIGWLHPRAGRRDARRTTIAAGYGVMSVGWGVMAIIRAVTRR